MSEQEGGYIQFPLCALSFGETPYHRLLCIISYGVVQAGIVMYEKFEEDAREKIAERLEGASSTPKDYDPSNWLHVAVMMACSPIGVSFGSITQVIRERAELVAHIKPFESKHGRDVLVRIKKRWIFEVLNGNGISYREFVILCALYSCIGASQKPVRVTKAAIQTRTMGFKSRKVYLTEGPTFALYSERQIGCTLESLHRRNFFACVRPNRRQTYFSHRLTPQEMSDQLLQMKTAAARSKAQSRAIDMLLNQRIKNEQARLTSGGHWTASP